MKSQDMLNHLDLSGMQLLPKQMIELAFVII